MNPLNRLARQSGYTRVQLEQITGLGRNTLDSILSPRREPAAQLGTIRQFAGALGYRVVLTFEPVEDKE